LKVFVSSISAGLFVFPIGIDFSVQLHCVDAWISSFLAELTFNLEQLSALEMIATHIACCFLICAILLNNVNSFGFTIPHTRRITSLNQQLKSDANEKLIFDPKTNRFYEGNVSTENEEFCLKDGATGEVIMLTKEEKERIFLDAVQSYYYSGKTILTDKQFDRLREDLSWEGSALVTLNRQEARFLKAMEAYAKNQPIMSDSEFDELKKTLREQGSKIAVSTEPKCYVDAGVCKVTWSPDTIRTTSLYLPAALFLSTLYLGITYEVPFIRGNINPLFLLALGAFPIYKGVTKITEEFLFKEPFVARGPCPNCGVDNRVFFGDVFMVKGDKDESKIKCTNCKSTLTVKRATLRVSTLLSDKKEASAPAAAEA
jgi:hypothetical protein